MSTSPLPYNIAVLCYLFDRQGRVLLLHRCRPPNQDFYSPVGGKLHRGEGESPTACAVREIQEETQITVEPRDLHLTGLITEAGFNDAMHWMMFLYEVTHPVQVTRTTFEEGRLEWHPVERLMSLNIPQTDRRVIWPLFQRYRGRFFAAHLACRGDLIRWRIEQPAADATAWSEDSVNY